MRRGAGRAPRRGRPAGPAPPRPAAPPGRRPRGCATASMARSSHDGPTDELRALAEELGLDVVGAAPAGPYEETERHIRERRARGLFGRMRFTMAQPEVSCHPETLLEGARTVVSAALCYYAPGARAGRGGGAPAALRVARPLRAAARAAGRARAAARRLRTACSSTRTSTSTAAGAERSGVGFIGKNTMLITRRATARGSSSARSSPTSSSRPTPPLERGCGSCTLCIDACPTDALDEPGVLDATRASRTGRRHRGEMPEDVMDALERPRLRLRHLPGRLPLEPRRREAPGRRRAAGRRPTPNGLARRVARRATARSSSHELERLYVPEERPALAAAKRARRARQRRHARRRAAAAGPSSTTTTRCSPAAARAAATARGARDVMTSPSGSRSLAHELRSPVAALAALAEALTASGACPPPSARRLLELAVAAGRDIERLLVDAELVLAPPRARRRRRRSSPRSRTRRSTCAVAGRVRGRRSIPTRLRQAIGNLVANGLRHGSQRHDRARTCRRPRRASTSPTTGRASIPGSTRSRAARAARARPGSASGSRARIAEAHGGTLELVPGRAGARRSGSFCRPLPTRALSPSSDWSACARAATPRRIVGGLDHDGLAAVGEHLGEQPLLAS